MRELFIYVHNKQFPDTGLEVNMTYIFPLKIS